MYVRQLARKKIKLETSSSIDTSSSLASSSSSGSSLVLTASGGSGGSRTSLTSSPTLTKKSPAGKNVRGGGGPVLTHTPVSSALRLAKGIHNYYTYVCVWGGGVVMASVLHKKGDIVNTKILPIVVLTFLSFSFTTEVSVAALY